MLETKLVSKLVNLFEVILHQCVSNYMDWACYKPTRAPARDFTVYTVPRTYLRSIIITMQHNKKCIVYNFHYECCVYLAQKLCFKYWAFNLEISWSFHLNFSRDNLSYSQLLILFLWKTEHLNQLEARWNPWTKIILSELW